MKRLVLAVVAIGLSWGAARAADAPPITRYSLENGLDVVLVPDKRVPKVVVNVVYRVGALNEPPGRSGFAHLFEHLMFSGTEIWPKFDDSTAAMGITNNAWTTQDSTLYYMEGLSSTLPAILSIEADRMVNLGRSVEQFELDVQRAVVKNEMRQNIIDTPASTGIEVMWSGLFPKGHPYSRSTIGSVADLDKATLEDVRGFFNTYYLPNNAILVVTGDFEVDAAREMIARTFGLVPRGADVARPTPAPSEPTRVRIELDDRVPAPMVMLAYSGPPVGGAQNGALAIAAEMIGNEEYGMLRDRLVAKGLATYAAAYWFDAYMGGRMMIEAYGSSGTEAAEIETVLRETVSAFLAGPLDPADVERAKRKLLLQARVSREALKDQAETIATVTDMLGSPEKAFEDDPSLTNATPEDVLAAAKTVLAGADASVLIVRPGQRGGYPPLLADPTGEGQPFTAEPRPVVDVPKLALTEPKEAMLPSLETATLSNGIKVVHYRTPDAPIAYLAARGGAGWMNAPAGKEGLLDMAASMAVRGAGTRDFATFAKAASDIGAEFTATSDQLANYVTLSVPPETFAGGVTLLADAVKAPRFDKEEWDILVAETLDWLDRREADLPDVAERQTESILFTPAAGLPGPDWSEQSVRAIGRDDAKAAFARMFAPSATSFVSVGPMTIDDVAGALEKEFGNWTGGNGFEQRVLTLAQLPTGRRVVLIPEPGASQTAILVTRAAPGRDEPGHAEARAVLALLGNAFTSRLNQVIREEKGYSYGVRGSLYQRLPRQSALGIRTTVQRDTSGPALSEYFVGFDSLVTRPVTQEELDRSVQTTQLRLAGLAETSKALFTAITTVDGASVSFESEVGKLKQVTKLSLDAVRKTAVELSSLDNALIVLAGDPDVVLPQLAAIGITSAEIVQRGPRPTADRNAVLSGEDAVMQEPEVGGYGSTRAVHGCADAESCQP